jgi:hypothetical protein
MSRVSNYKSPTSTDKSLKFTRTDTRAGASKRDKRVESDAEPEDATNAVLKTPRSTTQKPSRRAGK